MTESLLSLSKQEKTYFKQEQAFDIQFSGIPSLFEFKPHQPLITVIVIQSPFKILTDV